MISNKELRSLEAKARKNANVPVDEDNRNIVYRFDRDTGLVTVVERSTLPKAVEHKKAKRCIWEYDTEKKLTLKEKIELLQLGRSLPTRCWYY
jgi:hypothetical protein